MGNIDKPGTYLGTITESAFSITNNNYPQWVVRLVPDKFYAKEPEDLAHFQLAEPAYVDWNFGDEIIGYLVLFGEKGALMNYEQAQLATGWDGQDFQTLSELAGKRILFRVEPSVYNGVESLKVNWIDAVDAPPERTLKQLDPNSVKALTQQWLAGKGKPAAPAKPATVAAKPGTAKPGPVGKPGAPAAAPAPKGATAPVSRPAPTAAPAPATAAGPVATPATTTAPAAKPTPPVKKSAPPPAPPPVQPTTPAGLPTACDKMAAWDYISSPEVKGGNEDSVIEEAWIAATSEVGEQTNEADFTEEMWAKVRDIVIRDVAGK